MKITWLIAVEGELTHLQCFNTDAHDVWSGYIRLSNLKLDPNNNELLIPSRSARTEVDLLISLGYTDEQLMEHYSEYRDRVVGNARSK